MAVPRFWRVRVWELVTPTVTFPKPTLEGTTDSNGCTPAALNAMVVGELVAVLTTLTVPVRFPVETGAQVTLKDVDCAAARVIGSVTPLMLKPVPLAAIWEIVTAEFPVLVTVIFCEEEVPIDRLPKFRAAGLAESVSIFAIPVPLRGMLFGEEGALLARLRLPARLPAEAGENEMLNAAEAPGARESGKASPERL